MALAFYVLNSIIYFSLQYGTTPLIWAARKGHYDSVMHLLANGADVDQEGAVSRSLVAFTISKIVMFSHVKFKFIIVHITCGT